MRRISSTVGDLIPLKRVSAFAKLSLTFFLRRYRDFNQVLEIGEEEERLFLMQRAEIEFLEYRKCQSLTASPAHTRKLSENQKGKYY